MPVPLPGNSEETPAQSYVFEKFTTLNTKANRPSIKPEEFPYCDGFFPIGDANLRTLYAEGDTLLVAQTQIYVYPYNIGSTSYIAVFFEDGSAKQVTIGSGATTTIGGAGTFWSSGDLPACAQWQSKYLLIVSTKSTNGYWIWDGTTLFPPGGLSPEVTVTDGGLGYTSAPTVTAYGGSGSGATFVATVTNGSVTSVKVTNAGTGYLPTDQVQLAFSGGGSDSQAVGSPVVTTNSGGVSGVIITAGGSSYSVNTTVTFSGGGGSGAAGIPLATNGVITGVQVTNPGHGYTSAPSVTIADGGGGTGSGATAISTVETGQVTSISVTTGGSGYVGNPTVTITGDGTGATARANITAGAVSSFTMTNDGLGYSYASVVISGGNNAATATIEMMPEGISGTTIETYQSRVWIANGTTVNFTTAESVTDFSTSGGGGSYTAVDSFLRQRIVRLAQANGFLYQMADSSINVISNIQTSGTPATTTFNNSNVDPQIGTAWRDTVVAFGRALVFGNPTGIYALYGGAAEKVSSPLDGLFINASFNTGASGLTPTAGVATIFGIRCYVFLFTTIDPYYGVTRDMMACWDGQRWFTATQIKTPKFLSTQEINSELSCWAMDGTNLYELFQTPSTELTKTVQSKLLAGQTGYLVTKQVNRMYLMAENNGSQLSSDVMISVDNEKGQGAFVDKTVGNSEIIFVGTGPIQFTGTAGAPLNFFSTGLSLIAYGTSNYGKLLGITIQTTGADMTLLSVTMLYNDYAPWA